MNIALILSGGTGVRLGNDIPKQYIEVGGTPIISYCLQVFAGHPQIDAIHIVADGDWHTRIMDLVTELGAESKFRGFSGLFFVACSSVSIPVYSAIFYPVDKFRKWS